jgi:tetraacyldisaccharide 4'-kinase
MPSNAQSAIYNLQSGADRRLRARLARGALLPLSWLYGIGVRGYRALYDRGLLRVTSLPCRVIAVGNLTVGGTGKSTSTRWLARLLQNEGTRVAILSYGYHGRDRSTGVTVVSNGRGVLVPVTQSGDEPRMLADALPGVPVLIGPRRVLSGEVATREFGAEVCLLDDGFQYWRLRKDLEIVLIDATRPFGFGYLLPRGLLREPLHALERAHVLLVMNSERLDSEEREELSRRLRALAPRALLCEGRHTPAGLTDLWTGEIRPLSWLRGRRVAAISSLGNPDNFSRTLRDLGVTELEERRFPDHHLYTSEEALGALSVRSPWDVVVTTAKDAPKLRHAAAGRDALAGTAYVLDVDLEITRGEAELRNRVLGVAKSERETVYETA